MSYESTPPLPAIEERAERRWRHWWFFMRPPRWLFHVLQLPAALLLFWGLSYPGFHFDMVVAGLGLAMLGVGVWLVRFIGTVLARKTADGSVGVKGSRWYLVAPIAGALTVGLALTSVPLRLRWAVAKPAFERTLRAAPPETARTADWRHFPVPISIGGYEIVSAARAGDGVIFHEGQGSFLDDAGFAYLPDGPFHELNTSWFENPQFRSLGDGWYAWTASW